MVNAIFEIWQNTQPYLLLPLTYSPSRFYFVRWFWFLLDIRVRYRVFHIKWLSLNLVSIDNLSWSYAVMFAYSYFQMGRKLSRLNRILPMNLVYRREWLTIVNSMFIRTCMSLWKVHTKYNIIRIRKSTGPSSWGRQ